MAIRTLNFLPSVFQTTTNQKFLNATLDQLVSEPNFKKVNGYVGRKFAPTFKSSDNYLPEPTADRSNYQLEPSVVVQDINKDVKFFSTYMDLIQQISYYGGNVSNHSRLFSNESYSYNGQIDFDKLVNFNQYYWMPTGPDAVDVFPGNVDDSRTYEMTKDPVNQAYKVSGFGSAQNPTIYVARGGTYEFIVNQDSPFYIQTDPGTDGKRFNQRNIDTREVFGVTNNGASNGVITFDVPLVDAQDEFIYMPEVRGPGTVPDGTPAGIDYGTTMHFNDIDNTDFRLLIEKGGIDGETNPNNLNGKYLVFLAGDTSDEIWDENGIFAMGEFDSQKYAEGTLIPSNKRGSVWQIQIIDTGNGDLVVNLVWDQNIPINNKVSIKSGVTFANNSYYKNNYNMMVRIPLITAPLTNLYYNDGVDQRYFGRIVLVNKPTYLIDIERDIIGKTEYVSPNGVTFTNGLKIRFGSLVIPETYGNNVYYVEGVGTSIALVKESYLITPELDYSGSQVPFDVYGFSVDNYDQNLNGPLVPDYITINRSSIDYNAWSRSNRWIHAEVIAATAKYNNVVPLYDQSKRAARPIIEFVPNLQLFNNGRTAKHEVNFLDYTITDALNQVEGNLSEYFTQTEIKDGMTIVFANDYDPTVRDKIWKVNVLDINGEIKIHLTHVPNGEINEYDVVTPISGTTVNLEPIAPEPIEPLFNAPILGLDPTQAELDAYKVYSDSFDQLYAEWKVAKDEWTKVRNNPSARRMSSNKGLGIIDLDGVIGLNIGVLVGRSFWYVGDVWKKGQGKKDVNVAPLFDIIDNEAASLSDQGKHAGSTFAGCKLFSYKQGTSAPDKVLGFPVAYRNFNNIGDIEFENNFDTDTFSSIASGLVPVSSPINEYFIPKIINRTTQSKVNIWDTIVEPSRQYQIISKVSTGVTTYFEIDILPATIKVIPTIKVFLNNVLLTSSEYIILDVRAKKAVRILAPIKKGDTVDIQIYSDNTSAIGYYEVPQNLNFNSLNANFESLTLGQFRNHLTTIAQNSTSVAGQVPGSSNLRDLNIKKCGGNILQHSAPALYSSLFLLNDEINFVDSITLAQQEYSRFKNRFLEMYSTAVDAGITDPRLGVDFIMQKLNIAKNPQMPWNYSDMIPYDADRTVINYSVLNLEQTEYEIDKVFNDTKLSNKAILVYLNNNQLTKGIDYTFNQTRQSIIMSCTLAYDDAITIYIFNNTDGCFVPETPTKLGLYPKFTPEVYVESTYTKPFTAIRGHDGSVTPIFKDYRDDLLLELEKRIYNNIKAQYDTKVFDIYNFIPGKFRKTDYSRAEFNAIIAQSFLPWVGNNRADYSTNLWFSSNNPWSWTYNKFVDVLSAPGTLEFLPGHWKGIYKYFYDTDAPQDRPWECLGFSERPHWWVETYGPAPYTGGNLVMWKDLEDGRIRFGDRAGVHQQYARPGLMSVIPVTNRGQIRDPQEFLVTQYNGMDVSGNFEIGDDAPVESAWRKSSDYPFAVQYAIALMKPGMYFGLLANADHYSRSADTGQMVLAENNKRITPKSIRINGDTTSNTTVRAAGYLNWIVDFITNNGANPTKTLHKFLDDVEVRLGYRAAGFTDKSFLRVLAEQSSPTSSNDSIVIPDENYLVHLHKSASVNRIIYSAVIVEKTSTGYSVTGYNTKNPFFTIVPSDPNSNQHTIVVDGATGTIYGDFQRVTMTIPYGHQFTNKQQVVDFLISYQRYLLSMGFTFEDFNVELGETKNWELSCKEFLTWTQQGWGLGSILVLSPVSNKISANTVNAVVDHIDNSPSGSRILDIGFSVVRNSMFNAVRDGTNFSITVFPEITIGLLDLNLVQYEHALIFDNQTVFNDIIYKPELGNRQYRLKLIGNKTDGWAGQLTPPGFMFSNPNIPQWAAGQDYRKGDIVAFKGINYAAMNNIDANNAFNFGQWYVLHNAKFNTGMLPNFSYNAQKFENMYDVDNQVQDQHLNRFGNGLIGYRDRNYLTDLSLNSTSQAKFYQGYIKDKGTKDSISALSSAVFNNLSGSVSFNEEWAFRVGDYGATESNQFFEVALPDNVFVHTPIALSLLNPGETVVDTGVVGFTEPFLYKKPKTFRTNIFKNRDESSRYEADFQTAGYVNLNDIDATLFDMNNFASLDSLIPKMHSGYKIWVAKDINRDWNVYRVSETSVRANLFKYVYRENYNVTTLTETIEFSGPHKLATGDMFIMKGFDASIDPASVASFDPFTLDKFYVVGAIITPTSIEVKNRFEISTSNLLNPMLQGIVGDGAIFKLQSLRVTNLADIEQYTPAHGWQNTDKVWVDTNSIDNKWAVYSKTTPWFSDPANSKLTLSDLEILPNAELGTSVAATEDGLLALSGTPTVNGGKGAVKVFAKTTYDSYESVTIIDSMNPSIRGIGFSLDIANKTIAIGAPSAEGGHVLVYDIRIDGSLELSQIITLPTLTNGARFGHCVAFSDDAQWLYVGAPTDNKVFAFRFETVENITTGILTTSGTAYTLPFTPHSTMGLLVKDADSVLIPWRDYSVSGNVLTFTVAPTTGTTIIVEQRSYYDNANTLTASDLEAGDNFGSSIDTQSNGTFVVVGAPNKSRGTDIDIGKAYVFNRYVQKFVTNGTQRAFLFGQGFSQQFTPQIFLDGVELPAVSTDYTMYPLGIEFNVAPLQNQLLSVELNYFGEPIQSFQPTDLLYGANFGHAVAFKADGSDVFVSAPDFNISSYHGGMVYKFSNEALMLNTMTGKTPVTVPNENVNVRINDILVEILQDSTPVETVAAINNAKIVGVNATLTNGLLTVVFDAPSAFNRLSVLAGSSTLGLEILGLTTPYYESQTIHHPYQTQYERFGTRLVVDRATSTLLASSEGAPTVVDTVIDNSTTQLDGGVTRLIDVTANTGSAYVFEELVNNHKSFVEPSKFGFVQQLTSGEVSTSDNFGSAIAIVRNRIFVGANHDIDGGVINSGKVYYFTNKKLTKGWTLTREQAPQVDVYQLSKMYLYDSKQQNILSNLDYYDPIKGKILGAVDKEITYKTSFDPASYNRGSSDSVDTQPAFFWGSEQVGQVWWNLDTVRYVDYEQSDLTYRINNWGRLFDGSQIVVCEWVESYQQPAVYTGDGTPLYLDKTAYVERMVVDTTGFIRSKYYFWVVGKQLVDLNLGFRELSISTIADVLANPHSQNIPYVALLKDNSLALFNGNQFLSANKTVLHVDYAITPTENLIHNEYELVADNSIDAILPTKIVNKLIDSLTGADTFGHMVPDYKLGAAERYGINIRPRQSMIVNKLVATENFVNYVNNVFAGIPICEEFDLSQLYIEEAIQFGWDPTGINMMVASLTELSYVNNNTTVVGQRILVKSDSAFNGQWSVYEVSVNKSYKLVRTQSFKTTDYWSKVDWFDSSFDQYVKPTFTIETENDIAKLTLKRGNTIWIKNNGSGQFVVHRVEGFGRSAATKPDSRFFEVVKTYPALDALTYDIKPYGIAPGQFAVIDTGDIEDVDNGKIYRWDTKIDADNNAHNEWTYIEKMATSKGIAGVVGLTNVRDDGDRFYEITKVYSSSSLLLGDSRPEGIVEGQMAIVSTGDVTNPDQEKLYLWTGKYYQYITKLTGTMGFQVRQWQTVELPNANVNLKLVGLQNGTIKLSDALWSHNTNQIGFDNDNFDTVKYDLNPTIEFRNIINAIKDDIFINTLDGKFNDLFFTLLNYIFSEQRVVDWAFKTSFITVLHKLRKLGKFPNYIKDNQTFYESYINEVKPYRTKIREYVINYEGNDDAGIVATDFDIPAYYDADFNQWRSPNGEHARDELLLTTNSNYLDWNRNHSYSIESVTVSKQGNGYSATTPLQLIVRGGGLSDKSKNHAVLEAIVDYYSGKLVKVNVISQGSGYTSTPTIIIPGDGVGIDGFQTAVCYPKLRNNTVRSFDTALKFDRITYATTVKQWAANTEYTVDDTIAFMNKAYRVTATMNSGTYFNPLEYVKMEDGSLENAVDRVATFYNPTSKMLPKDPAQLFSGVEYPDNRVDGTAFVQDGIVLDTEISSALKDTQLGLRPEDINIIGGKFVDTFSSHAPEELVPGLMFDTLDMKVFTVNLEDPLAGPVGFRISKKMSVENRTTFDNATTNFDNMDTAVEWNPTATYYQYTMVRHQGYVYTTTSLSTPPLDEQFNSANFAIVNFARYLAFYDILTTGNIWEYRRICKDSTTRLVKDLHYTDTEIFVADVTKLPIPSPQLARPGVVYLNGEKITYYGIDEARNALTHIRRGTWGTGVPAVHKAWVETVGPNGETTLTDIVQTEYQSLVVDASADQEMPADSAVTSWLNPAPVITSSTLFAGDGLLLSQQPQALFLKQCVTYLPWVPSGILDPSTNRSRFDEGPYTDSHYRGEVPQFDPRLANPNHQVHPYDVDPYDSYRIDI